MKTYLRLIFLTLALSCSDGHVDEKARVFKIFNISATIGDRTWKASTVQPHAIIYQDYHYSPTYFQIMGKPDSDTLSQLTMRFEAYDSTHYEAPVYEGTVSLWEQVGSNVLNAYYNAPRVGHIFVDSLSHWTLEEEKFYIRGRFDFLLRSEFNEDSVFVSNGIFEIYVR